MSNCNCSTPMLNDEVGVTTLKELYKKEGAGSVSFIEKITNNIPVLSVGLVTGGVLGFFIKQSMKKKGR